VVRCVAKFAPRMEKGRVVLHFMQKERHNICTFYKIIFRIYNNYFLTPDIVKLRRIDGRIFYQNFIWFAATGQLMLKS
jgi:hypothetical protein